VKQLWQDIKDVFSLVLTLGVGMGFYLFVCWMVGSKPDQQLITVVFWWIVAAWALERRLRKFREQIKTEFVSKPESENPESRAKEQ
jgi:hypothetical protein